MRQIILQGSLDFSGFILSGSRNSRGRPNRKRYFDPAMYRGIKIVRQLKQVSEIDCKFFKELKVPKLLLYQCFCKNEERKAPTDS